MEVYIRLQSKKYDVNEKTRSFEWSCGNNMWEAMEGEISIAMIPIVDAMHRNKREEYLYEKYLALDEMEYGSDEWKQAVEELWNEIGQGSMVLPGVSCYRYDGREAEAARQLYEYFAERAPEDLESDEYYVLIFEGRDTWVVGHNGEDVAVWVRDIERVPTKEFFARFPNLLDDEDDEDEDF